MKNSEDLQKTTSINEMLETLSKDNDRGTKLGRRRLIEELKEQQMLEAELGEYEFA